MKYLLISLICLLGLNSAYGAGQGTPQPAGTPAKRAATVPKRATSASKRTADNNLEESFAQVRKAQVRKVDYQLYFTLNKDSETYNVKAALDVELTRTDLPLSLDLVTKSVDSVRVNGASVTDTVSRKGSLDIPAKYLAEKTRIEVDLKGEFNKDGEGFQRSVDPEDKSEYLFSDFEPYYAHTLFPCFDQPDLKATYTVTVDAPKEWKVIGNSLIDTAATTSENGRTHTRLLPTKRLSPYLFFIAAGPFVEWADKAGDIPLYIYARKTLAMYMDADRVFDTTKKGLKFYSDYFGTPYPFPKYGQIFIPEFAWGGMENPGAVALNEANIFRGAVSQSRMDARDSLILHEMAHMWFGDLVTMNWWNDLWLNESFASYVSSVAQDRALQTKGTWLDFFSEKTWGYWQDQLTTTHPIEVTVADTRTAKGNFDGITYAKGAATLKQLHFSVGEEGFREGIRSYFKKFAYQNTSRQDFIAEIAHASKQDLSAWTKTWLQTSGPNRVHTNWSCSDGKIATFEINQTPSVSKTLSPHHTRVGLYKIGPQGKFATLKSQDVSYSVAATEVTDLKGVDCPDFAYPNVDDHDYALFTLDPISLKNAKQALTGGLEDPLLRLMLWNTLEQMVRDTKLGITSYFDMALATLKTEKDDAVLGLILGRHSAIKQQYFKYLSNPQRAALASQLETIVWERSIAADAGSSTQLSFFDFYVGSAQSKAALSRLQEFLQGEGVPKGIELDQDRRWNVLTTLAANSFDKIDALIAAEEKKDTTTAGARFAAAARAAVPTQEAKLEFWQQLQKPDSMPFSTLRAASSQFNSANHPELANSFTKDFFKKVRSVDWKVGDNLVEIYFENLFPHSVCSQSLLEQSRKELKQAKNLTPLAKRGWIEANDELAVCVAVRSFKNPLVPDLRD